MTAVLLSKHDFNNIINYGDVRSAEFSLIADGAPIGADDYILPITSRQDVVYDGVSARRVADIIERCRSYELRIAKPYPFHEALVEHCVRFSARHGYGYAPIVVAVRNSHITLPAGGDGPVYIQAFAGDLAARLGTEPLECSQTVSTQDWAICAVYRPLASLQREILHRLFRKSAFCVPDDGNTASASRYLRSKTFADDVSSARSASLDADRFFETLLQLWPCGARLRLSSAVLMGSSIDGLFGEPLSWNVRSVDGQIKRLGGDVISRAEATPVTIEDFDCRPPRQLARSRHVDELVMLGVIGYRGADPWRNGGWNEICSAQDPSVLVRSDGVRRWMSMAHGGIESIELLATGENRAVGASHIARTFGALFESKQALFLGLGLGVLQRTLSARLAQLVTVESSGAVIEIFRQLYGHVPGNMQIVQGEFYGYLQTQSATWDIIVIDHCDPDHMVLRAPRISRLLASLRPGGSLIINKNKPPEDFWDLLRDCCATYMLTSEVARLEMGQCVIRLQAG